MKNLPINIIALLILLLFFWACDGPVPFEETHTYSTEVDSANGMAIHRIYKQDSVLFLEQKISSNGLIQYEQFRISDSNKSVRWYDAEGRIERSLDYFKNDSSYTETAYTSGVFDFSYNMKNGLEVGEWVYYKNGNVEFKLYFPNEPTCSQKKIVKSTIFLEKFERPSRKRHYSKKDVFWSGYNLVHLRELYSPDGELLSRKELLNRNQLDSILMTQVSKETVGAVLTPNDSAF